jgi:NADPH-dependent 2,4-dienoyl-CoA reductase/sulfur reductase-like enzyme
MRYTNRLIRTKRPERYDFSVFFCFFLDILVCYDIIISMTPPPGGWPKIRGGIYIMKKTDLLVIGGSAGGLLSALAARSAYGNIDITVVRMTKTVMVPCGIPYIFGTLFDTNKNIMADSLLTSKGINLIIEEVMSVDKEARIATLESGELIEYKKLILSTGSKPVVPTFIKGYDKENIYPIRKSQEYLVALHAKVAIANKIAVIGGGFIGVEIAEQIKSSGKDVVLVELAEKCLWTAFDEEFSAEVEDIMTDMGIVLKTGRKVVEFVGDEKVEALLLDNGEKIPADLVILGMGARPNNALAESMGLELNNKKAIQVDEYMRTSDKNIFAVGDCSEKKCFFTRNSVPILLASTAAAEAKIAGSNAFQLRLIKSNKGTISAFATKIRGRSFGAAGLTVRQAEGEGFEIMTGEFSTMDKHPGSLPGSQKINIKLVFSKCSGVIMGGQISGGDSIAEMVNVLSLAIQKAATSTELNAFQVATHPLLTASPVAYPINAAAMDMCSKRCAHLNEDLVI